MTLTLSADDLQRLARAGRALTSPLDHGGTDGWRSAVNRELRALVGAEVATFVLPSVSIGPLVYSDEADVPYPEQLPPPLPGGITIYQRLMADGVGTIHSTYSGDTRAYYQSWYHNEHMLPYGMSDLICLAVPLEGGGGVDAPFPASVQLMRGTGAVMKFDDRELRLLRLLHPAFMAGAALCSRWHRHRTTFLRTIDALGQAVLVCDARGRALHQTPALAAALTADSEADTLRGALVRAAAALGAFAAPNTFAVRTRGPSTPPPPAVVRTATARYRVLAILHGDPAEREPLVLASLERLTPARPCAAHLRAAFALTPAESRVALLLAEGRSNAEVAQALAISPFTARRHTERVLDKLGVRTRASVGARLRDAVA